MMGTVPIYNAIKRTVHSYLPDSRVLLFGSRANGNEDKHSDYDILVITTKIFTQKEKSNLSTKLDKAIVTAINAPIDLLLFSEAEVLEKQELPGHILRSALRDGIAL